MNLRSYVQELKITRDGYGRLTVVVPENVEKLLGWKDQDVVKCSVDKNGFLQYYNLTTKITDVNICLYEKLMLELKDVLPKGFEIQEAKPLVVQDGYELYIKRPSSMKDTDYWSFMDKVKLIAASYNITINVRI